MEGMMKLLRVRFGDVEYRKDFEKNWPDRGLKADDMVSWTGERYRAFSVNYLQVVHPEVGLIWVPSFSVDAIP
jgi:hypothetical protein